MKIVKAKELIAAHRDIEVPFRLTVQKRSTFKNSKIQHPDSGHVETESELTFIKILRLLPSKRIVALARYENRNILVKTFLGKMSERYATKELAGVNCISKAGVRTPNCLWQASLVGGAGQVLAFDYLEDSVSLQDRWEHAVEDEDRVDILTRAMIIIAKLHNVGVVQTDIHLGNFLMFDRKIYTIDGGGVSKKSKKSLSIQPSLDNLSWFFAQFFPKYDEFIQIVFPAYEAVRGWSQDPDRIMGLFEKVTLSRDTRKNYFLEKIFRDCTRFICKQNFNEFMVCERSEYNDELSALLANPDDYMAKGKLLKNGNTATVALVHMANKSLVIKRYNIKGKWHALQRSVQKTRAWLSWANAYHMEFLGIRSLKPVAMIEKRLGALRGKAYFITEYIEGPDALAYLPTVARHKGDLEALASLIYHLSMSQISHGDLKATNFVMAKDGPVIIDLDAMRQHKNVASFRRAFRKDIERFMKNWEDQPELASAFDDLLASISSSHN